MSKHARFDLEKTIGPMRIRAWGLVLNLIMNVIALYGLTRLLSDSSGGWPLLALGVVGTVICLLVLARPVSN